MVKAIREYVFYLFYFYVTNSEFVYPNDEHLIKKIIYRYFIMTHLTHFTFCIWLIGVTHMIKGHSNGER